jgi:hypothetical protein
MAAAEPIAAACYNRDLAFQQRHRPHSF